MMIRPGSVMMVRPPCWLSRRWPRKSSRRCGPDGRVPGAMAVIPAAGGGAAGSGAVTCGACRKAGATVGGAFCARPAGGVVFGAPGTAVGAVGAVPAGGVAPPGAVGTPPALGAGLVVGAGVAVGAAAPPGVAVGGAPGRPGGVVGVAVGAPALGGAPGR